MAIPLYQNSVIPAPNMLLLEIESLVRKFDMYTVVDIPLEQFVTTDLTKL